MTELPTPQQPENGGKRPQIELYFRAMTKLEASDLHLKAGLPAHMRVDTGIRPIKAETLTNEKILELVNELLTPRQQQEFEEHGSIDVAYEIAGSDRYRINVFRQRGNVSLVARRVTRKIPNFEQLNLPPAMQQIAESSQGLVLLSGATGSGKSTTIASMLEHINRTRACHIVTIEDPIEYLYEDKKSVINQREVGLDVENFSAALKYLMRQDPDVVLVGEMRDKETFRAALQASETGHLVFGTIHASSAPQTFSRILELFPSETHGVIRQSMAFNLKAIICQKLLPSIHPGCRRVPAIEILQMNATARKLVQEGHESDLADLIRASERDGMQSFTMSLLRLVEQGYVDIKVAYEEAPNVDELKMLLKGISSGRSGLIGR